MTEDDKWAEYSKLVLSELKRLDKCVGSIKGDLITLQLDMESLKVKAGVWGLIGAAIPVSVLLAIKFFINE